MYTPTRDTTGEADIPRLVREAQEGNEDSLSRLYELLSDRIYRYILMRVSHRETAEDITQVVFIEMIRSLPRYTERAGAKFSTWLFQIARHRLIDHYRRQKTVLSLDETLESHPNMQVDPAPPPDDALVSSGNLTNLLKHLSERQQTILHLFFQEEMSLREIADILDISIVSVRVEKHRALKKLKHMLLVKDSHLPLI